MGFKNSFGITKEMVAEIARETSKRMKIANEQIFKKYDIHMSNKNLSEIVSKVMEKVAADTFSKHFRYKVIRASSDRDPDLTFTKTDKRLEIKVTSTTNAWTGGEFSKRPFDYLLVSWGGDFDEFFIAFTHLEKSDWKSRFEQSFYGPSFDIKKLYTREDKEIFLGTLTANERGTIKMIREKT